MYFLNYEILEYIIDKFGNKSIKQRMETYKQDLRWFRKKTPLELFLLLCGKNPRDYDCNCYKQVVFHLPAFWINYTLEDVYQLHHSFASRFYLSTTPLQLYHVGCGSVVITWLVPVSIIQDLSKNIQQDDTGFMSEQQALQVTVDGTVVYEQPPKTPSGKSATLNAWLQIFSLIATECKHGGQIYNTVVFFLQILLSSNPNQTLRSCVSGSYQK